MRLRKWIAISCVCMSLAVIVACSDSPTKPDLISLHSSQGPCLRASEGLSAGVAWSPEGIVHFRASFDTLFVYHDSAYYGCGASIKFDFEQEGRRLDFIEVDTALMHADCMCYYDLEAFVSGLARGMYVARVWSERRAELLREAKMFVPGN